jgi:hypothetical protein
MSVQKIKTALAEFDISAGQLSAYVGRYSQSRLSRALSGESPLPQEDMDATEQIISAMRHLSEHVQPKLPIAWGRVDVVKPILEQHEKEYRDRVDPIVNRLVFVRLSRTNFLQGIRTNGTVIETMNYHNEGAAFEDYSLAAKAVQSLKAMGVDSKAEVLTAPRRRSTITNSLQELGFAELEAELAECKRLNEELTRAVNKRK